MNQIVNLLTTGTGKFVFFGYLLDKVVSYSNYLLIRRPSLHWWHFGDTECSWIL